MCPGRESEQSQVSVLTIYFVKLLCSGRESKLAREVCPLCHLVKPCEAT
jgi:hypothetical protein